MKTRTTIICYDGQHEVAITMSVRTNQPGMNHGYRLTHSEHRERHNNAVNVIHDGMRNIFNASEIKLVK